MRINQVDTSGYEQLCQTYGLQGLAAKVCVAHQLSHAQIEELLKTKSLCDPNQANGVHKIIQRLTLAKQQGEHVLVCGDYDADGICATTILYDALKRFGIACGYYIPNRFKEGYGLHRTTIDLAKQKGYSLLITVDNGVKCLDELMYCQQVGIEVIVSDHHTMDGEVPCAYLLHPSLMGEPFTTLCGAGVALQLARALIGEVPEHVVLACVASIGDVMPLWQETRSIVKMGLRYLNEGVCLPIQALAKGDGSAWDVRKIAFQVVPKLNTTGRLADQINVNQTVRYLLMSEASQIAVVAQQIDQYNQQRRSMSNRMCEQATHLIQDDVSFQVLYDESFHEGLSGLVAGKLVEQTQCCVAVFANGQNDLLKGSIRSFGEVDLRNFFQDCPFEIVAYGGHQAAAGITIHKQDLGALREFVANKMTQIAVTPNDVQVDAIPCRMEELSVDAVAQLTKLAPFGEGFPQPLFYIDRYPIKALRQLSGGKHLKWESLAQVDALYFNAKDVYARYKDHTELAFLGTLAINEYRNEKKVNIFINEVIS